MTVATRPIATSIIACMFVFSPPCLWDYDTLREERQQFPQTLELITGKFVRHSKPFYEWRVKDRGQRLSSEPENLALYDDLAVALDKIGRHDDAIAAMLKKESLATDRYETAANLGTFHIHKGEFEEGLAHIKRAIEINPDAHFGREVYQQRVVEYVIANSADDVTLPLYRAEHPDRWSERSVRFPMRGVVGFGEFVLEQEHAGSQREEIRKALKGIQGMMRFGHHDSPVLLEALGMLLMSDPDDYEASARRLAARAFLKASYEAKTQQARLDYRMMAKAAIAMQTSGQSSRAIKLETIESRFRNELREADDWFANGIEADETRWVQEGSSDVDALFDARYRGEPSVSPQEPARGSLTFAWAIATLLGVVLLLGMFLRGYLKKNPQPKA